MKKFKKIMVIIPIIVILFSLICIPVSADTGGLIFGMPISRPYVTDDIGYLEILLQSKTTGIREPVVFMYTLSATNDTVSKYATVTGTSSSISFRCNTSSGSGYIYVYGVRYDGSVFYLGSALDSALTYNAPSDFRISGAHFYGSTLSLFNDVAFTSQIAWSIAYGEEYQSQVYLAQIIDLLRSKSNADIIADADKNANEIKDNADKNANEIKENADKNTSQITDGYQNDTDTTLEGSDDYKNLEEEAIGSTNEQAKNEASNVTEGANNGFLKYMSAFTSVGNMFADFFQITVPDFGILVMISLAVGILPLLVGLSVNEAKARDRFNSKMAKAEYRQLRNRQKRRGG